MRSELRPLDIRNVSLASSDGGVAPTVEQLSVPESLPVNEVVEWRRGIALARGIALCGSTSLVPSEVDMGRDHPLPIPPRTQLTWRSIQQYCVRDCQHSNAYTRSTRQDLGIGASIRRDALAG